MRETLGYFLLIHLQNGAKSNHLKTKLRVMWLRQQMRGLVCVQLQMRAPA